MMEDDFYATLKLISGEEIFAKVSPSFEIDKTVLLLSNPIVVSNVQTRNGSGYKIEPWLKTTKEDMFIIDIEKVLTISESNDIEMITMYQSYVRKHYNSKNKKPNISKRMGYIGNVNDAKELLEKIYKNL
jgi:hypothetical protein